jgi:hypothetical protein
MEIWNKSEITLFVNIRYICNKGDLAVLSLNFEQVGNIFLIPSSFYIIKIGFEVY